MKSVCLSQRLFYGLRCTSRYQIDQCILFNQIHDTDHLQQFTQFFEYDRKIEKSFSLISGILESSNGSSNLNQIRIHVLLTIIRGFTIGIRYFSVNLMYIYKPNSVVLPPNSKIKRNFPTINRLHEVTNMDTRVDLYDVMPSPFEYNILARNLDTRTVFYDVYINWNTKILYGFGPCLFNLESELFPMELFVNGNKIEFKIYQQHRLFFIKSKRLPNSLPKIVHIELVFKSFTHSMSLDSQQCQQSIESSSSTPITISTLQKNNDIQWVIDWILWHRRLHNVERIVLYDNGSTNRTELIKNLKALEPEVKIIFVDWPFPYGIYPNHSTQLGSLNHCRIRFPIKHGYCINLDIDEYLVRSGEKNLLDYLNASLNYPFPGVYYIKECKVPNITTSNHIGVPRVLDFHFRFREFGHHPTREFTRSYTKYIYKFNIPYYFDVHRTILGKHDLFEQKLNFLKRIQYCYKKILWKIKRHRLKRQNTNLDWKHKFQPFDSNYADESEFYFFHFMGLSTNWQKLPMKGTTEFNSALHIKEPLIEKLSKKARLVSFP